MKRHRVAAAAALSLAIGATSTVAAAPQACTGSGQVWPVETPQVRLANGNVFVEFDFAGVHPICLADGTVVPSASVAGHLWQQTRADGSVFVRFDEVLTHDGGELYYRGNASYTAAGWHSAVRTVGDANGSLAGIVGQGTFSPIAADGSFSDEISYVYP